MDFSTYLADCEKYGLEEEFYECEGYEGRVEYNLFKNLLREEYYEKCDKDELKEKILTWVAGDGSLEIDSNFLLYYSNLNRYRLIHRASKTENDKRIILLLAVESNQIETIKHLLSPHSSLWYDDALEWKVLMHAMKKNRIEIVDYLVSIYLKKISFRSNYRDMSLLAYRILKWAIEHERIEVIAWLVPTYLDRITGYLKIDELVRTLGEAVKYGDIDTIAGWLDCYLERAAFEEKDIQVFSIFLYAVQNVQIAVVDYLLSRYPDKILLVEKEHQEHTALMRTALMLAEKYKHKKMREYLLTKYLGQCKVSENFKQSSSLALSISSFAFHAQSIVSSGMQSSSSSSEEALSIEETTLTEERSLKILPRSFAKRK